MKVVYLQKKHTKADAFSLTKALLEGANDIVVDTSTHEPKYTGSQSEGDLQKVIIDHLELLMVLGKLFFQRVNVGGVYDARSGTFRSLPSGVHKGFPDIFILKNGQSIFLELKSNKGSQSDEQKIAQQQITAQGGKYYIVRSYEYFLGVIESKLFA